MGGVAILISMKLSLTTRKIVWQFYKMSNVKLQLSARCWWLTPVIPAAWEAEIRRIMFEASSGK
jgi:hypothetical protein